jgi:hypothetical protein
MYKTKYLKYKSKYLKLKQTNNQTGGNILTCIRNIFRNLTEFADYFKTNRDTNNSFQICVNLMNENIERQNDPYNILIGCTNEDKNDYCRFNESTIYSLYIDNYDSKTTIENPEKQYNMYTINYNDIEDNILSFPAKSVSNIHFDTCVSYFAPIKYLDIAQHVLVDGGKIVWDLLQHQGRTFGVRNGKIFYNMINNTTFGIDAMQSEFNINIDTEKKEINYRNDELFSNKISPQINVNIVYTEDGTLKSYNINFYTDFLTYCEKTYTQLTFELKSYTYSNYTYPVPIRIIPNDDINNVNNQYLKFEVYDPFINFVLNEVMDPEDIVDYVNTKLITREKLSVFCNKILLTPVLKNKIELLIPNYMLNLCKKNEKYDISLILSHFFIIKFEETKMYYIEATKKSQSESESESESELQLSPQQFPSYSSLPLASPLPSAPPYSSSQQFPSYSSLPPSAPPSQFPPAPPSQFPPAPPSL